jgi:protein TonB
MSKRILLSLLTTLFVLAFGLPVWGQTSRASLRVVSGLSLSLRFVNGSSEREQDGLNGPVRRVRTETAKLGNKSGKLVEGQRVTLEVAAYDIKGAKIENAYFPVPGAAITGKEVYKYDDKGNIMEMTLQDEKGTLLSKETYTYEFDQFGNWTKMTTSVAVIENGKITFEPTEVTYRSISYYLDEATLARMNQPAATAPANTGAASNVAANSGASNNNGAASVQPASSAPSKPVSQTGAPANGSSSTSKQPSQMIAANNKPAATPDASKQSAMPSTTSPASNSSSAVVKTSAPVSDKPAGASGEQAKSLSASDKPVESKSTEEPGAKPVIKPLLKPVSGGVLNGKAINLPKPTYPPAARSARIAGVVIVEVVIDVNGKVISARAMGGPGLLQQAAVQAAYQAKFSPTLLSDQPVKVVGTINYNFAIGQ